MVEYTSVERTRELPTQVEAWRSGDRFVLRLEYPNRGERLVEWRPFGSRSGAEEATEELFDLPSGAQLTPVPSQRPAEGLWWSHGAEDAQVHFVVKGVSTARLDASRVLTRRKPSLLSVVLVPLTLAVDAATFPFQLLAALFWIGLGLPIV